MAALFIGLNAAGWVVREAIFTHDTPQFNLKKEYSYFPPFTTRGSGACDRDVKSKPSSGLSGGGEIKFT